MPFLPFIFLFSSSLILRTILAISSSHWLLLWFSLELNLFSFIPIISFSRFRQETEARIKYFLIQAFGSGLFLIAIFSQPFLNYFLQSRFMFLLLISLFIKLGIAPFHFWFPRVIQRLRWPLSFILRTWQKLIPIFILFSLNIVLPAMIIFTMGALRTLIGGWGGFNQSQIRPLLAYSSIGHIGWIISRLICSTSLFFLYLLIYLIILFPIIFTCIKLFINSVKIPFIISFFSILLLAFCFFSLGGLPPLLGFIPKWIILTMLSQKSRILLIFLITGSLLNIFYYLNIFNNIIFSSRKNFIPQSSSQQNNFIVETTIILTILTIFISPLLFRFIYAMIIFN